MQPCAPCINDASGVESKAAPGGQDGRICGMSDGGIDAGEAGGGEPPRRLSGGRCGRSRRQSCAARCRRRRRWCPRWCGQQCTARCGAKCGRAPQERPHECGEHCGGWCASRCAAKPAPGDARCARGPKPRRCPQPARGGHGGHLHDAVEPCHERVVPARGGERQRAAGQARSERSERRREGYPPEGSRPRSGLGRVARSRSDAPSLIVVSGETASSIGTIGRITACTVVGSGVTAIGKITITITTAITGNVAGARRTLLSSTAGR